MYEEVERIFNESVDYKINDLVKKARDSQRMQLRRACEPRLVFQAEFLSYGMEPEKGR